MTNSYLLRAVPVLLALLFAGGCVQQNWQIAQERDDIAGYEQFLKQHPDSRYAAEAKHRLHALQKDIVVWRPVQEQGSLRGYEAFVEAHPQSPYAQKAQRIIDRCCPDAKGEPMTSALDKKRVEVRLAGRNVEAVSMEIRRRVDYPIKVTVPAGTFFKCDGAAQDMVAYADTSILLATGEWQTELVAVVCANRMKEVPDSADSFGILPSAPQAELRKLMPVLAQSDASYAIAQAAVWIVTDDASYSALSQIRHYSFRYSSGTRSIGEDHRAIGEAEAALAMKLCEQAGINIARKAIWRDRREILRELKDEQLRQWLDRRIGK